MRRVLATLLGAGLLAASATAAPVRKNSSAPAPGTSKKLNRPYQVGRASWYGKQFDGRSTASGEPFDMQALTAAHPTLPLGSFVRVTNLRNGRAVVVRINDRGPVVEGRIIDLSYNTARVLGFEERGLQRVRLDLVRPASMARLQTVASLR